MRYAKHFILVVIHGVAGTESEGRDYWDGKTFCPCNKPVLMTEQEADNARFDNAQYATIEKAWWL
jgi:hypothetical protein